MSTNVVLARMHPGRSSDPLPQSGVRAMLRVRIGSELEAIAGTLTDTSANEAARAGSQARMRLLGQLLAGLADSGTLHIDAHRAGFGSTIELVDLDDDARRTLTLVTGATIDVSDDQVTMESPIGAALLGAEAGDVIDVDTPARRRTFRVLRVRTLLDQFGKTRK